MHKNKPPTCKNMINRLRIKCYQTTSELCQLGMVTYLAMNWKAINLDELINKIRLAWSEKQLKQYLHLFCTLRNRHGYWTDDMMDCRVFQYRLKLSCHLVSSCLSVLSGDFMDLRLFVFRSSRLKQWIKVHIAPFHYIINYVIIATYFSL